MPLVTYNLKVNDAWPRLAKYLIVGSKHPKFWMVQIQDQHLTWIMDQNQIKETQLVSKNWDYIYAHKQPMHVNGTQKEHPVHQKDTRIKKAPGYKNYLSTKQYEI